MFSCDTWKQLPSEAIIKQNKDVKKPPDHEYDPYFHV